MGLRPCQMKSFFLSDSHVAGNITSSRTAGPVGPAFSFLFVARARCGPRRSFTGSGCGAESCRCSIQRNAMQGVERFLLRHSADLLRYLYGAIRLPACRRSIVQRLQNGFLQPIELGANHIRQALPLRGGRGTGPAPVVQQGVLHFLVRLDLVCEDIAHVRGRQAVGGRLRRGIGDDLGFARRVVDRLATVPFAQRNLIGGDQAIRQMAEQRCERAFLGVSLGGEARRQQQGAGNSGCHQRVKGVLHAKYRSIAACHETGSGNHTEALTGRRAQRCSDARR